MIHTLRNNLFHPSIRRMSSVLLKADWKKLVANTVIQIIAGLLDLIGVIAIGALAALSVQGLESRPAGNRVSIVLRILHISQLPLQAEVAILGSIATAVLVLKTV